MVKKKIGFPKITSRPSAPRMEKPRQNLYMHTIDGKPAMYQEGTYICYVGPYTRVTTKQMFKTSLSQIYKEQRASAQWQKENGGGVSSSYGYIRMAIDGLIIGTNK